jgi:hypothetical protein
VSGLRGADVTPTQIKLARHALGLPNDQKRSYRNRYFTPIGSRAYVEWCDMVADGMARGKEDGSRAFFWMTLEGAIEASEPGETLDMEDFENEAMI